MLDHFLISTHLSPARGETHPDAHFPSDHCPITVHIPSVAVPEPMTILEHRRRFRPFPPDLERLTDKYSAAFACILSSTSPASVPDEFHQIVDAFVEAAHTVYSEPVAYDRLPAMVRQQQESLRAFLLGHPFSWTRVEHLHQVLALQRAIHTAWCIATLESQLGLSRPHRHEQPSAQSYRLVFGRQLGPSMDPKYVVGMSVNPRLREHVILDQLRQRHLTPVGSLSQDYVSNLMAWQPLRTPFIFPLLTVALLRDLLHDTPHTSPYRDLIEYVLLRRLSADNLHPLLTFYNAALSGARVPALHHGDFALLPKKAPHGIVGNGRPLATCPFCGRSYSCTFCVFTSGRPMTCTLGWMPATPPSAM